MDRENEDNSNHSSMLTVLWLFITKYDLVNIHY